MRQWHRQLADKTIQNNGIIALPTEAVFGVSVRPDSAAAVFKLLRLKRRPVSKGLIIVAADISQVTHYIYDDPEIRWSDVFHSWPGPVTWVFPASRQAPDWITGDRASIAIRVSAHPIVNSLCSQSGPLVSTSANPDRCRPAKTVNQVRAYFQNRIDYLVPGKTGSLARPTEIRDAITGQVFRAG